MLKAFMQPHLLGNEFTHLEFPRRIQRNEVGKRMLYRDFTMAGWWVDIFLELLDSFAPLHSFTLHYIFIDPLRLKCVNII